MSEADAERVRAYVHREHADLLANAESCADAVVAAWDGETATDRESVVPPLEYALRERGVHDRLPDVLAGAVAALGEELQARPVAGPPYVVVTSVGPVLRATLPTRRLVVTLRLFAVCRDEGSVSYARATGESDRVTVAFR